MSEGTKCLLAVGRRSAAASKRLVREVVGPLLFLAVLPAAGLVGCAPSSAPELVAPSVLYVSRVPHDAAELRVEEKGAAEVTVTFDARDLKGVAVIKPALDACPVRLPVFHCTGKDGDPAAGGKRQYFRLSPAQRRGG